MLLATCASCSRPVWSRVQKERPHTFKVRPRAAIKRAPSLTARLHAHAVHEAACSEHAIVLVCGANSSHAYRTCRASCGGGIVIAVSRSSAHGGHAGIVSSVGGRASMLFGGRNWSSLRPPRRRSRGLRLGGCSVGTLCWSALDLDGRCRAHRVHRSAHRARVSIDGISNPFE